MRKQNAIIKGIKFKKKHICDKYVNIFVPISPLTCSSIHHTHHPTPVTTPFVLSHECKWNTKQHWHKKSISNTTLRSSCCTVNAHKVFTEQPSKEKLTVTKYILFNDQRRCQEDTSRDI